MNCVVLIFNLIFFTLATAFIKFEDNKEYEFHFKSKFVLAPEELDGGQNVTATILVKKFGTDDSLIIRIKDSTSVGKNIHSKSKSDIEGVFGIKRRPSDGVITHLISKSTRGMEILCKKMIVDMLSEDLSFFGNYAKHYHTLKNNRQHEVKLAIGWCSAEIEAVADPDSRLIKVLGQAEKAACNVDNVILMAGQLLMHGTTDQIGRVLDDSNFGMTVFFDSTTEKIVEVAKFTFLNLKVAGFDVQARHNMVLQYVGERALSWETEFQQPYNAYTKEQIEDYVRNHER